MSTFLGVVRHELGLLRRNELLPLVALYPIVMAVVLQMLIGAQDRPDLGPFAVAGPWLVGMWQLANLVAGETLNVERWRGTLEHLVAAPASTTGVLLAKLAAVSSVGLVGLGEAFAVAALFGRPVAVHQPVVLGAAAVLTLVATTTTSLALVGLYVASRTARTFQNTISFPILVLGGAVVPVTLLPDAVQPLSRLVFLSWAGDLLRAGLTPDAPPDLVLPFVALTACAVGGLVVGSALVRRALQRARVDGTLALS